MGEIPGTKTQDTHTALGWSAHDGPTHHGAWGMAGMGTSGAPWAAEEPPTREAGHALDTHHAHSTAN